MSDELLLCLRARGLRRGRCRGLREASQAEAGEVALVLRFYGRAAAGRAAVNGFDALEHAAFVTASVPSESPLSSLCDALCRYFVTAAALETQPECAFPQLSACECEAEVVFPPAGGALEARNQACDAGGTVGGAVLARWRREEAAAATTRERNGWGTVDVVWEDPRAGLYRLNVAPGASIPAHTHRVMHESEMVLGTGLLCQGRPVARGTVHRWGGARHGYHNPDERLAGVPQTVLCVDAPPFLPEDEVVCDKDNEWDVVSPSTDSDVAWAASPEFEFPGAWPGQRVRLVVSGVIPPPGRVDAAVVVVLSPASASASASASALAGTGLLLVRHRVRGWELPGGKLEAGETAERAARRECLEEAGAADLGDLVLLGWYSVSEATSPEEVHVKAVFLAAAPGPLQPKAGVLFEDTDDRTWVDAGAALAAAGALPGGASPLLQDGVLPVILGVASRAYGSATGSRPRLRQSLLRSA